MDSSNATSAISLGLQKQEEIMERSAISKLQREPQIQLEDLVLTKHPFQTLRFFTLAVLQHLKQLFIYAMTQGWLFLLIALLSTALGVTFLTVKGPHEKHMDELLRYIRFGLWWVGLGVASSIGLGSGLHTFVLYLGPHIAFFTIKATQCGRIDLKGAPYDTIQLNRAPSWIDKSCEEFGSPLFPQLPNSERFRTPLFSILPQVQLEAVLWGLGTALGELPPYFLSRAARLSGKNVEALEELNATVAEGSGTWSVWLNRLKRWSFSKSQHLNFFTILVLASVPNPLFDLAGMLCGQFSVSFWEFFTATLIGKAVFKTHIQTAFIILVCNNQLVEWVENEFIWILEHIPALSHILPHLMEKLHTAREKFYHQDIIPTNKAKGKRWNFSLALIWNTFVWLMLIFFFNQIITATAQNYARERRKKETGSSKSEQVSSRHSGMLNSSNGIGDLKSE